MAQRGIRSLTLPASFAPTHQTAGLAGFPAIDVFGQPGTPVISPVTGRIVDVHMIPWNAQQRVGGETAYLQGANDRTYFLTHLMGNVPTGPVTAGQQIGQVGAVPNDWWQPHIHEGMYQGIYNPGGTTTATPVSSAPPTGGLAQAVAAQLARFPGLDPRAVLAVAGQEGLGGGIGDQGTSFGPFQLHYGGAYPSWAPQGSQAASQAWATSPQGIQYALSQIAPVARGLTGQAAISNIVSRFERPANIPAEIAGATRAYGATQIPSTVAATPSGVPTSVAATAPPAARVMPPAVRAALAILRA